MQPNTEIPRPEHPRPDFCREAWLNLNGRWSFCLDPDDLGQEQGWFAETAAPLPGSIIVPFPWQSKAARLNLEYLLSSPRSFGYEGVAWYHRAFTVPATWAGQRVILHFGAVDYAARVWVNAAYLGEHEGGYLPFDFDITDVLREGENSLTVRVYDPADLREIPHGKQIGRPPNPWNGSSYDMTSGIWQTVWLEPRPAAHIVSARILPEVARHRASVDVQVELAEAASAYLLRAIITAPDSEQIVAEVAVQPQQGQQHVSLSVPIAAPILWDIAAPNLYEVDLVLSAPGGVGDTVHTYFGMRTIAVRDGQVLLNGRPIYLRSALDQGYYEGGQYTAPTDDALRADIEYAQELGFNGLRKHIKVEDPRYAYWADRKGLLLWCEPPSPVKFTALARERLVACLRGMIERDYNHPSIVIWGLYNESWGLEFRDDAEVQAWLIDLFEQVKAWDPSRLVVDNSGWRHVRTEIADWHKYTGGRSEWRHLMETLASDPMSLEVLGHPFYAPGCRYGGEPLMVSEYGYSLFGAPESRGWCFKWQTDEMRRHAAIVGYTYTQLYGIGDRGLTRLPLDYGPDPAMVNHDDYIVLDFAAHNPGLPPIGSEIHVPVYVSAYGQPELTRATFHWWFAPPDPDVAPLAQGTLEVNLTPYSVTELPPIHFVRPAPQWPQKREWPLTLWAELRAPDGTLRARNYIEMAIVG